MATKKGTITYKCWQIYGVDEADMIDGICPICDAERQKGDPELKSIDNVGFHIHLDHQDFLRENNINSDNKIKFIRCNKCGGKFQGKVHQIDDLATCCRKCYKASIIPVTKHEPRAKDVPSQSTPAIQNDLDAVVVLKGLIGMPDSFFKGKKMLNVDLSITQSVDGDVVKLHVAYVKLPVYPAEPDASTTT